MSQKQKEIFLLLLFLQLLKRLLLQVTHSMKIMKEERENEKILKNFQHEAIGSRRREGERRGTQRRNPLLLLLPSTASSSFCFLLSNSPARRSAPLRSLSLSLSLSLLEEEELRKRLLRWTATERERERDQQIWFEFLWKENEKTFISNFSNFLSLLSLHWFIYLFIIFVVLFRPQAFPRTDSEDNAVRERARLQLRVLNLVILLDDPFIQMLLQFWKITRVAANQIGDVPYRRRRRRRWWGWRQKRKHKRRERASELISVFFFNCLFFVVSDVILSRWLDIGKQNNLSLSLSFRLFQWRLPSFVESSDFSNQATSIRVQLLSFTPNLWWWWWWWWYWWRRRNEKKIVSWIMFFSFQESLSSFSLSLCHLPLERLAYVFATAEVVHKLASHRASRETFLGIFQSPQSSISCCI